VDPRRDRLTSAANCQDRRSWIAQPAFARESHDGGVYKVMTEQPAFDLRLRDVQFECWTPVFRFALALTNVWDVG
jgi:hypothetical protein